MAGSDPFIILARIGAPNGVRGAARVKLFGDDPASLAGYGPLQRADGKGSLTVASLRPGKTPDMVVATFEGVTNRDHVVELNGVELGLPRSALPNVEDEDDFYHTDLIGLEARLIDGSRFGEIIQVANYGADDLLDIKPDRGGPTVLVPFTKAIVPTVKIADGYVALDPPDGLLDPPKKKPAEADG
ncbi:MAG: ribosome maturation factor RimM [Hyphomicrobiales bacterium]|jgi:16S rRNA processing protein RimM